jgi:uncharacterized membrane protein YukC
MFENLSISDLLVISKRLKAENTILWYNINSAEEIQENTEKDYSANEKLIAEIEQEITERINKLKYETRKENQPTINPGEGFNT